MLFILQPNCVIYLHLQEHASNGSLVSISSESTQFLPAGLLLEMLENLRRSMKYGSVARSYHSQSAIWVECTNAISLDQWFTEVFQRYFPEDFQILPSSEMTITVTSSWYFLRSPCGMSNNSWKSIPAKHKHWHWSWMRTDLGKEITVKEILIIIHNATNKPTSQFTTQL